MNILRKLLKQKKENQFLYVTEFKEGYALALQKQKQDIFYIVIINKKYEVVETTDYYYINVNQKIEWQNGYIVICEYQGEGRRSRYFFDKNLKKVGCHDYRDIEYYNLVDITYIKVITQENLKGILDENLNTIIKPEYEFILYLGGQRFATKKPKVDEIQIYSIVFKERKTIWGKEIVSSSSYRGKQYYKIAGENLCGYCNEDFEWVIEPAYQKLSDIDEKGNVFFSLNGEIGFVNIVTGEKRLC